MTTQHSPLPWRLGMKPGPIVYGPSGEQVASLHVAMVPVEENDANAQYIVQACNAFPALYAALEEAEERLLVALQHLSCDPCHISEAIKQARAALALARGEKGGEVK